MRQRCSSMGRAGKQCARPRTMHRARFPTRRSQAASDVARDHLDWLDDYDAALCRSADGAARSERLDNARRAALAEGIAHLRALVALAGRAATKTGAG